MSEVRMVRFNSNTLKVDIETDRSNKNDSLYLDPDFGFFYTLCFLISIVSFAADILMHCMLAYAYHSDGHSMFFFFVVTFIIVPSIVSTGFSMRWYILDEDDELSPSKPSLTKWCLRILTMLLQITQIHRYCDALLYGLRSSIAGFRKQHIKQDCLYRKMLDEDCNAALLRLFYCILNSAPQGVLHLTLLLRKYTSRKVCWPMPVVQRIVDDRCINNIFEYQCVSIGLSVFSVAWSLTMYDRTNRYIREDKKRLSFFGTALNFLSQLTWAASRIFALSMFATFCPQLVFLGVLLHSTLMSVWLLLKPDLNHNRCDECLLNCMLGVAYIFVYISSHTGPQRYSYGWYYVICFIENIGCLCVWYYYASPVNVPLYQRLIYFQMLAFFGSMFFLILYYKCFHPNRKCGSGTMYEVSKDSETKEKSES